MSNNENNLESGLPNMMENQIPTHAFDQNLENTPVYNNIEEVPSTLEETPQQPVLSQEKNNISAEIIPLAIVNAIVIFAIFYLTINKNILFIIGSIALVILGSIMFAVIKKEKSEFPTSVLIGGILSAVICFVVSMLNEKEMDLWTYYAMACTLTGIIGFIVSNILTHVLTNLKNIKALETIGYILFFVILFGGSYLAYKKWPTEFNKYVLFQKNEVVAQTYEDYVTKTLKARYNVDFNCDFENKSFHITENREKMATLKCKTSVIDKEINIKTIPYNESKVQYTIIDDFLDQVYLNEIKTKISEQVAQATGAAKVVTYLYPKDTCIFTGDCVDCEEYYKDYDAIYNSKKRYELSSSINLSKYMGLSTEEFITNYINESNYKIVLNIKGTYNKNSTNFIELQNKTLAELKKLNLKNTYGYEITFFDTSLSSFETKLHNIVGKTNDSKEFK